MTLDAMTFASGIRDELLNHQLTDEYAAALRAMQRSEPQARARVLDAYTHLRAHAPSIPVCRRGRIRAIGAGERGDHPSAASAASLSWRAAWPNVARLPFTV